MSYILDALKKSEREKTLGQVPTLESVISDGAKKQRSGTPWWLNLLVFFVAFFAVFGIMKMTGLINSPAPENQVTQQPSGSANDTESNASRASSADSQNETQASGQVVSQTDQTADAAAKVEPSAVRAGESDAEDNDIVNDRQTKTPGLTDAETEAQLSGGSNVMQDVPVPDDEITRQLEQEAEELAALELKAQQQNEQRQTAQATSGSLGAGQQQADVNQPTQPQYEEALHDSLRGISVNVVSYSSNARQRFVMLDMTIYKEGDQLANTAQLLEITRTGAIVEFQNKRYMLKP
jgi:general secretion pathway protein B